MITYANPLKWPQGYPRSGRAKSSQFDRNLTIYRATADLAEETRKLRASYPVLTTDLRTHKDGKGFYSNQRQPDDLGVSVFFEMDGTQMVFACDRFDRIQDNIRAIAKTISALRGIERWGASEMMRRAFQGFTALPAPDGEWWDVLGVPRDAPMDRIKAAYRARIKSAHPDRGGDPEEAARLNRAMEEAEEMRND